MGSRTFDYQEANRLHATGLSYADIARRFSVSVTAVRRAVNPALRQAMGDRQREWQRGGICIDCGDPVSKTSKQQQRRCRTCSARAQATTVRKGELRCVSCGEWKPDEEFPNSRECKARRGRHRACRACATVKKREWRQRTNHRCERCGTHVTPDSHGPKPATVCRPCYRELTQAAGSGWLSTTKLRALLDQP